MQGVAGQASMISQTDLPVQSLSMGQAMPSGTVAASHTSCIHDRL